MEVNWTTFIEDVLLRTYVAVKGNSPDSGSFRPDEATVNAVLSTFGESEETIKKYCEDALCSHIYSVSTSGTHAPFWVNTRLMSAQMLEYVSKNRGFLRERFAGVLSTPTMFYTEVYSDLVETEIDYLTYRAEFEFRGMPFDWSLIQPTLYWYIMVVEGIKEFPCDRLQGMAPPEHWATLPIECRGRTMDMDSAVFVERKKLSEVAVRRMFAGAAEKALYETSRQWCESRGLMKLYLDRHKRVAISPEFSVLTSADIDITFPLSKRDQSLFARAKEALEGRGIVFEPMEYDGEPLAPPLEHDPDSDQPPPTTSVRGVVFRGGSSLERALSTISSSPDN